MVLVFLIPALLSSTVVSPVANTYTSRTSWVPVGLKIMVGCSMVTCPDTNDPSFLNSTIPPISMDAQFVFPQISMDEPPFSEKTVTLCKEVTKASYISAGPSTFRTTYTTSLIPVGQITKKKSLTAKVTTMTDVFEYRLGAACDGQGLGVPFMFKTPSLFLNLVPCDYKDIYDEKFVKGSKRTSITLNAPVSLEKLQTGTMPEFCYVKI